MKITEDLCIVEGYPVLFIKSMNALVCSDLHLGYEGVMAEKGNFIPKVNLKNIKRILTHAVNETKADRLIIDGDIKNEFSKVHIEEFKELRELVDYLKSELELGRITLIKGNHDNFVDRVKNRIGIETFSCEMLENSRLFFHGDGMPREKLYKLIVMGHLHPAITLYNKVGVKEKLHCFLYGKTKKGQEAIVLPAMNYFAEGVGVNTQDVSDIVPFFRSFIDINNMRALCLGEREIMDFGVIGNLRAAAGP